MANTITTTTLTRSARKVVLQWTLKSDGTQETNTIIYDSSAQAALITLSGGVALPDPLTCSLNRITYSNNSAAGVITLKFDASTPVIAVQIPFNRAGKLDYSYMGGLKNYAGSGITGDITITTTGLASGESITLVLEVLPN